MNCTKAVTVRLSGVLRHQAATRFIQTANSFDCNIRVTSDNGSVNAKSLLGVISLSAGTGTQITLDAEGADAEQAVAALEQCLSEG